MTVTISYENLARLSSLIADLTGLYFPEDRFPDLERNLGRIACDLGFKDVEACAKWILSSRLKLRQFDMLVRSLTIGETYFFR